MKDVTSEWSRLRPEPALDPQSWDLDDITVEPGALTLHDPTEPGELAPVGAVIRGTTDRAELPAIRPELNSDLEPASKAGYSSGGMVIAGLGALVFILVSVDFARNVDHWGDDSQPLIEALLLVPLAMNLLAWLFSKGNEEVTRIFRRDVLPTVATLFFVLSVVWTGVRGGDDDVKKTVAGLGLGIMFSALNIQSFKVLFEAIAVAWRRKFPKQ